jgi:hypothetical protein
VWARCPPALAGELSGDLDVAGDVVVVDPAGLARVDGPSPAAGAARTLEEAVAAGHQCLTGGGWAWVVGVPADPAAAPCTPAPLPRVLPLREIYREPGAQPLTLKWVRAEYRITPFQPRDELTVLWDFCERVEAGDRTGVAVVHGSGGSGKTRLALELAQRLRADGWYAGPLRTRAEGADPASVSWLAEVRAPLLVVMDYADARTEETARLLQVLADRAGPPVVVVLLTGRPTEGDWLPAARGAQDADAHACHLGNVDSPTATPRPVGHRVPPAGH